MIRLSEVKWTTVKALEDTNVFVSEILGEAEERKICLLSMDNILIAGVVFKRGEGMDLVRFIACEEEPYVTVANKWLPMFDRNYNGNFMNLDHKGTTFLAEQFGIEYDSINYPIVETFEPAQIEITEHAEFTDEYKALVKEQMNALLDACEIYDQTNYGVEKNLQAYFDNKSAVDYDGTSLLDKFVNDSHYNGYGQLVFKDGEFNTGINKKLGLDMIDRIEGIGNDHIRKMVPRLNNFTNEELNTITERLNKIINRMRRLNELTHNEYYDITENSNGVLVNGFNITHYEIEYARFTEMKDKLVMEGVYNEWFCKTLTEEGDEKQRLFTGFVEKLRNNVINHQDVHISVTASEGLISYVNEKFGTNYVVGMRLTKLINRVLKKHFPFVMEDERWIVERKEKSNPTIETKLGDALNPTILKGTVVLSINPIDYLTMSFGTSWRSCHNIDKELRAYSQRGDYANGCCANGPFSYMEDTTSMIFYMLPSELTTIYGNEADESELALVPKKYRCMFHYSDFRLIQSRVYPQSMDSSDELRDEFRAVVQEFIANSINSANSWTLKRGAVGYADVHSHGTHYEDFFHSNFKPSISTLKGIARDFKPIEIGAYPFCLCCGNENDRQDKAQCDDCDGQYECYHCGDRVSERDAYRGIDRYGDTVYFCCEYCADNEFVYIENEGYMSSEMEGVYQCSHCGNWYYDYYNEDRVIADDGTVFCGYECAESEGYIEALDEDGSWIFTCREVREDDYTGDLYIVRDYPDAIVPIDNCDYWFHNEDSARDYGCVCVGDNDWYSSAEAAIDAGYMENLNGEWVLADGCTDNLLDVDEIADMEIA